MRIRLAQLEDASAIAAVHVQSWRETYGGLVPESEIEARSLAKRDALWQSVIAERPGDVLVVESGGRLVGFACIGPPREPLPTDVELYALYLLASEQHRGLGRALFAAALHAARERRHKTLGLWVLDANPSTGFYERMGGRRVATRTDEMGLDERAYAFDL